MEEKMMYHQPYPPEYYAYDERQQQPGVTGQFLPIFPPGFPGVPGDLHQRVRRLEEQNLRLEREVDRLNRRVDHLERRVRRLETGFPHPWGATQ
jgi:hypothetical protein